MDLFQHLLDTVASSARRADVPHRPSQMSPRFELQYSLWFVGIHLAPALTHKLEK